MASTSKAMDLTRKRLERARALVPQTHSLDGGGSRHCAMHNYLASYSTFETH